MTDRTVEAKDHIVHAWEAPTEGQQYLEARLLWLELALNMLSTQTEEDAERGKKSILSRIRVLLKTDGIFSKWTMLPVLEHLKPNLSNENHALLVALVDALGDPACVAKLDEFQIWSQT